MKSYNKELNDKIEELKNDLQDKLDIIKIKDERIEKLEFDIKENLDNEKKEIESLNEEKIKLENIIKSLKKDLEKDIKKSDTENKNIDKIKDKVEEDFIKYIENYFILNHEYKIYKEVLGTYKAEKKLSKYNLNALGIDEIIEQDNKIEEIKKQLNEIFKI